MTRFDEHFLEELKTRIRPSDLIGKTVKLRRQGREYAGLSPFAKEKSPSFFVNDDKGFYHCFSSGKHGDVIKFLQETERLTFVEAVERLAAEAGMALPVQDARAVADDKRRGGLLEWLELAAAWYQAQLTRPVGGDAQRYLTGRGFPSTEWGRFRIGYAPESRTALKDYLVAKGAKPGELVDAGLLIAPEDGSAPYDRFRNRVMFPITDGRGRVISFGGRALDPAARAKYLNGPETAVFHKGRVLYGLPEARRLMPSDPNAAPLAVVEGYMDVIACQRAGVAAVAAMGTALGEEQMEILWRIHPEPTLCFDGDDAGRRAACRTIERALPLLTPKRTFRFAAPKGGKDPDDVLRELGAQAVVAQMRDSMALADALWTMEFTATPLTTPEAIAGLRQRLKAAASAIQDKDLSQAYWRDLMGRFDALFAAAKQRVERAQRPSMVLGASDALKAAASMMQRGEGKTGRAMLQALLNHPQLSDDEARLADLLMTRDDLDRSISGVAADFTAAAMADLVRLKAERTAVDEQIREAQHQVQGRAA